MPPEPCIPRWGTFFDAVVYHRDHLEQYQTFFASEDSDAMHITRILDVLGSSEKRNTLLLKLNFISEACTNIQFNLTKLEGNKLFAPPLMFCIVDDLSTYLQQGCVKTSFGDRTDAGQANIKIAADKNATLKHFHDAFYRALQKLSKHVDASVAMSFDKDLDLHEYWKSKAMRIPTLANIVMELIWIRTTSVDVERSFSRYKHLLTDK